MPAVALEHPITTPLDEWKEAIRIARAASHSKKLDSAMQAAIQALVAVAEKSVALVHARDSELDEMRKSIRNIAGVTFGDP